MISFPHRLRPPALRFRPQPSRIFDVQPRLPTSSAHPHRQHRTGHHRGCAAFPRRNELLLCIGPNGAAVTSIRMGEERRLLQCQRGRRPLSTRSTDGDDFDIPPLDLFTPSLSIPLPPNMTMDQPSAATINGDAAAAAGASPTGNGHAESNVASARPSSSLGNDAAGTGGGSFLSRGIGNMKNQFRDRRPTSVPPVPQTKLDQIVLPDPGVSREDQLVYFKERYTSLLQEQYPRSSAGPPPQIAGGKRGVELTRLTRQMEEREQSFLKDNSYGEKRLFYCMKDIHLLQEYGVSRNQLRTAGKKREYKTGVGRAEAIAGATQKNLQYLQSERRKFYAEYSSSDPPAVQTSPLAAVSSPPQRPQQAAGDEYPSPDFSGDAITTQAHGTTLGRSGSTCILSTVVLAPHQAGAADEDAVPAGAAAQELLAAVRRADARGGAAFVPLQVEYRARFHAAGKIPGNRRRRDGGGPLSDREMLAARAVDRAVRPWLLTGAASASDGLLPDNIVVNCGVQAYDPRPFDELTSPVGGTDPQRRTHADPTALAINSTIAALYRAAHSSPNNLPVPAEAAACVKLALSRDGTVIFDPTPGEVAESDWELLYAGTRDRVLMLEFAANGAGGRPRGDGDAVKDPGIAESAVAEALRSAHEAIVPIIEKQERLRDDYLEQLKTSALEKDEALMTDEEVARFLGLQLPPMATSHGTNQTSFNQTINSKSDDGTKILYEANSFIWSKVKHVAMKLFGYDGEDRPDSIHKGTARIHDGALLPKKVRGRRENILRCEISRLLRDEFVPFDAELAGLYHAAVSRGGDGVDGCLAALTNQVHEGTMKKAMAECARKNLRSDGRRGLNVVRSISATAPIFPDSVHGSALFSRGETQVLCTATVGAPKEGLPIADPYADIFDDESTAGSADGGHDGKLPVGSLRFLQNQAEMESDMNSKRVRAGREMTGDSGILSEVKRAFLHYDFPDFSTGVASRVGASANRRAVGHGNLAEKAILPALPHLNDFPYTIRLTCEVTSSNGSSSMASACGASLALLDAGVPLVSPVAGVSVGLAPGSNELLLDITGTEDHYGDMDFKICGTYGGITAMQLDVKRPLSVESLLGALDLAKDGRHAILNAMENECKHSLPGLHPRSMKSTAPRVEVIKFDPNRKRDLIGPGGAVLRQLEDRFNGVTLDLSQEGRCLVFGPLSSVSKAKHVIMELVSDVEEGGVYEGTVIAIKDFGAVVELLRNKEGLLHVSEITDSADRHPGGNIGLVKDHLKVGDKIEVLCTKIDHVQGSIRLSRKKLLRMRRNTHSVDAMKPSSLGSSKDSLVQNAEEAISIDNFPEEDKAEMEPQERFMGDGSFGNTVQKEHVGNEVKEIGQLMSTVEESDEEFSSDDDIDDDVTGYDTNAEEDEVSLGDCALKLETAASNTSLEGRWMERYDELNQYNKVNGNCNVPRSEKKLGNWVQSQRSRYKKGILSTNRVQLLNELGIIWSFKDQLEASWDKRFDELKDFNKANGHCNVRKSAGHLVLGNWIKRQRSQHQKGLLSDDRTQRLSDLGLFGSPNS